MKYVALLRGIAPTNPNMHNEKLRGVFLDLGFEDVMTVISSGNVIFESDEINPKKLEEKIEKIILEDLGYKSPTIIRSDKQIKNLLEKSPFKDLNHTRETYLNVTFLKNTFRNELSFPFVPRNKGYEIVGEYDNAIFSKVDLTRAGTPDIMSFLEKTFGKEITTRTWKTVGRIFDKMNN